MFTNDGIRTTPGAIKADLRTTQFGTARKPASFQSASFQPLNLLSTLSHQPLPCGPPSCCSISLMRKPSKTAFLAHWFTCQSPFSIFSATRSLPLSSAASVSSIASRVSPVVADVIVSRASQAASMAVSSWAFDMGVAPANEGQMLRLAIQSSGPSCNDVGWRGHLRQRRACCDKGRKPLG